MPITTVTVSILTIYSLDFFYTELLHTVNEDSLKVTLEENRASFEPIVLANFKSVSVLSMSSYS